MIKERCPAILIAGHLRASSSTLSMPFWNSSPNYTRIYGYLHILDYGKFMLYLQFVYKNVSDF